MSSPSVLIIGCGFGGLEAARAFSGPGAAKVDITVVDKTNHHLFQPLLYQVATAGLSPGDIERASASSATSRGDPSTRPPLPSSSPRTSTCSSTSGRGNSPDTARPMRLRSSR